MAETGTELGQNIADELGVVDTRARDALIKLGRTVFEAIPPDPLQTAFIFSAACLSTLSVGDCIKRTGTFTSGLPDVIKVNISDSSLMPAVGIVTSKPSTTQCVVSYFGAYNTGVSITTNAIYFVGADARPTITRPSGSIFVQILGFGLDSSRLMINPSMHMTKLV